MAPTPGGGAKNSRYSDTNEVSERYSDTTPHYGATNACYGDMHGYSVDTHRRYGGMNGYCDDMNPSYNDMNGYCGDSNRRYGDMNGYSSDTNTRYGYMNGYSSDTNPPYGDTNARCGNTKPIDGRLTEWLQELKNKLHDRYQKFATKGLPWKHNILVSFSNFCVDEEIKTPDINKALKRVLSANEQPLRVLVEGPPDYENTNLLAKLCFDYANYEDYIKVFDVVLQYQLHHFNGNLKDIFTEAAELKDSHDKGNLLKIINSKFTRVLLLLDGFDEVPKQHEKAILSLLRGEQFPNVAVVITSRPGQLTLPRCKIKILGENGLKERFVKNPYDRIP